MVGAIRHPSAPILSSSFSCSSFRSKLRSPLILLLWVLPSSFLPVTTSFSLPSSLAASPTRLRARIHQGRLSHSSDSSPVSPTSLRTLNSSTNNANDANDISDVDNDNKTVAVDPRWNLKVAIVGAGPSGLLLAHRLYQASLRDSRPSTTSTLPISDIDIFEKRSDPRSSLSSHSSSSGLGGRAYALGLGIRGRTALRTVDESLWEAIKRVGFECERFRLHFNSKISIKLRDGEGHVEPSVLIYQSDLCSALLEELARRTRRTSAENPENREAVSSSAANVTVYFDSEISRVDLLSSMIFVEESTEDGASRGRMGSMGPYDLIIGCDGANSKVRQSFQIYSPPDTFRATQKKLLPSCYKVARVDKMPPLLDGDSVALLLPEGGSGISGGGKSQSQNNSGGGSGGRVTAFVEPTVDGGACILFAGKLPSSETEERDDGEEMGLNSLLFSNNTDTSTTSPARTRLVHDLILRKFPLLEGTPGMEDAVTQLLMQRSNVASSVKCNVYHSAPATTTTMNTTAFPSSDRNAGDVEMLEMTAAALCGDSAHATGGVSGQGCNSALVDAAVLADCLLECYQPQQVGQEEDVFRAKRRMLHQSLLSYSQKQVPEGRALYDLSFGNDGKASLPLFQNLRATFSNAIDTLFRGRFGIGQPPLQTQLASSLKSFAELRREREMYYVEEFPSEEWFREKIGGVYYSLE